MFDDHHVAERGGEIALAGAKAAPGVVVSGAALAGADFLDHGIMILTGIFLLLQIFYLLWKWRREAARKAEVTDA